MIQTSWRFHNSNTKELELTNTLSELQTNTQTDPSRPFLTNLLSISELIRDHNKSLDQTDVIET